MKEIRKSPTVYIIHNDGDLEGLRNKAIQFLLNEENIKFNT